MAYLDVISLEQAKNYLRVDDTLTTDDNAIQRTIAGALSYVEQCTNVLVYDRQKDYLMIDGCVTVYDAPINGIVSPTPTTDVDVEQKTLHTNYVYGSTTTTLSLNVGYENSANVPQDLIEVAYEIIDLMYYEHETGKDYRKDLTSLSKDILNKHKRFLF